MKLFTKEQIQKFFSILDRMDRCVSNTWVNPNSKSLSNPDKVCYYCQKEVFVLRTINKWLKGKLLIIYKTSEQSGKEYKQYISIRNCSFLLDYGGRTITVDIYDYSKPMDFWKEIDISCNELFGLEGEWCENSDLHNTLLKLTVLDIPEKEYVFKTYDFDKYPKRRKKGQTDDEVIESLAGEISFFAQTEKEAYIKKETFQKSNKTKLVVQPDIIKIINHEKNK